MKKALSLLLVLVMLCSMMPMTAFATEEAETNPYDGKVISILGDSISTFAGYIPAADGFNLEHYARYPQDNLFTEVEHTWWMQVLTTLDAKLGINESWRSTEVYNYIDAEVNSSYDGTKACMASLTRIQNLGSNGTPDVILFFGGTNDITQSRPVGTFDPAAAPTEVDLTSVKWDSVADAYVDAIMRMQYYYPDAQIVAMLPFDRNSQGADKVEQYNSLFISICEHYGVPYVDLRGCGISDADLPDGTHPDATGMDYITAAVMDVLMSDCSVEAGEHIVHSVTHNLTGAESSRSYYKGISHGNSFETTITGENLEVTVTMGGVDVTDDCYASGVVSIEAVTGDVVITASGTEKTIYADYLQELPEHLCSGTNLWAALTPINLYYTGSGWGLNASGSAYSISISISEGDQLWATSFQKSGANGGTRNGIRLTWFDKNGVLESVSPDNVYAEFSANGYLTAPEGAVAVNVVMWNGNESNEVYILNRDHIYENGVCLGCGTTQPGPVIVRQPADSRVKIGETYAVSVEAVGDGLTYQWYGLDSGSTKWFKSSVKKNVYSDVLTEKRANRQVYCVITDANGNSVTTETAKLLVAPSHIWEQWTQPVTMVAGTYPTYSGDGYRKEGQVVNGIIYSSTFREGTDALWNFNHSTYYSAAANPASLLYTVNNAGRVYNEAAWMGSVCSTTALKACGYTFPYTSAEVREGFREKTDHSLQNLEFGDILWTNGHVAGIIGIGMGTDNQVESVKIIEQSSYVKVFDVTAANWDSYFDSHWKAVYRGTPSKSLTAPVEYPENYSIIFERGNNTYVTDYSDMLFYIPTATTVYLTKNGVTTSYEKSSFPTRLVNNTTVYDLASLFTGTGNYYFHTEENSTDMCIKVIDKGDISLSGTTAELSGYSNCKPLGYRVIKIHEKSQSKEYNFFHAPEGYTSEVVNLSFQELDDDTFEIENIPQDTAGWKLEVFYDTGYGWARQLSDDVLFAEERGPVITQQPVGGEAKLGERYMVEVLAEGEELTYQWYGRDAGSKSWFKSSVKDNTYDDVMTETRAGREVYCVITDANGNSVTTDTVKLVLLPSEKLEIVTQPIDGEAVLGERYCVTVEAQGESLKYQWYFRNKGAEKWSKSGVTDNTYDDVMTKARDGREVYCVITDLAGNKVTSDTVKLVRIPMKLEIVTQPTDATAHLGEMFCATVEAKGEGLKYQWYYRNAGSEEWQKSGVRDNTYDDEMTKARNGRDIYCVITDQWGSSITTNTVKLIAVPSVELKLLGVSYESAAMGEMFCVTVEAQGDGLKYQWYGRNAGSDSWFKSSVTDNTYDDVMNKSRANREVYCVITDALGNTLTTDIVKLIPEAEEITVETEAEPQTETEPVAETEPQSETESVTETEPQVETEPVAETEPQSETEPVAETEPQIVTEPVTETEPTA